MKKRLLIYVLLVSSISLATGLYCLKSASYQMGLNTNEQSKPPAQFELGQKHYIGNGVPIDYVKAFHLFQKEALLGHVGAQFNLCVMYEMGQGVSQDQQKAFDWCEKAALQGDPIAQWKLSEMYDQGRGVLQDKQEAMKWKNKATSQGVLDEFNLDIM